MASVYFSILTAINVWRARRSGSHVDVTSLGSSGQAHYRTLSIILSLKYMGLVAIQTIALPFGFLWSLIPYILDANDEQGRHWSTIFDIRDNIRQLPIIHTLRREEIEVSEWLNYEGFILAIPMNGIVFFLLFGLDSSALSIHHVWLETLGRKISDIISSIWSCAAKVSSPLWKSSQSTHAENVTPFQLDAIPLAPQAHLIPTTTQGHLAVGPLPATLSHPLPHRFHSTSDRLRPIPLPARVRTLRKERISDGLLPIIRQPDDGGPRDSPGRIPYAS
ncbi:hypothetical protein FRC15_007598 [Serendipita sp. 397]|nr:hypothetical protein FRC15_007598 [Serendipita sp. 397]